MIITVPNPVLTSPAKFVVKIDKKILQIIVRMKEELVNTKNPRGVGLAAPQIAVPLKIFITRPTPDTPIEVFINPEIIWASKEQAEISPPDNSKPSLRREKKLEGCLSIPKVWGYLKRSKKVKLRYLDINGKLHEKEFIGFMATIVQHESDHLNGILYTKRVLEQGQKLYEIEKNEKGEEKLIEIII